MSTAARSVYGADKAITNFPVAEYTARLAAAGIAPPAGVNPPAPAPGAEPDATAVLMAALANVVHVRTKSSACLSMRQRFCFLTVEVCSAPTYVAGECMALVVQVRV